MSNVWRWSVVALVVAGLGVFALPRLVWRALVWLVYREDD